jgi:predicted transcriptional regulator of viral defense system
MTTLVRTRPDWDHLYETASSQDGHFTTRQAAEAGYSFHALLKHVKAGRVSRDRRGVYRLVHFPAGEREDLAVVWLWSDRAGIFSHRTALSLHGLSDVMPRKVDLTLPREWAHRRLRVPPGVVLHHADVPPSDRAWSGAVPLTTVARTLNDCAVAGVSPEHLQHGAAQALRRGLVKRGDLAAVQAALREFGGLPR